MATDKKHIAVYLAPEVEQALIAFCESKGLISKKGTMFSAGVNAALAEFFGTAADATVIEKGNTPSVNGNILSKPSNIPYKSPSNIPDNPGNILSNTPSETLAVEVLPGKLRAWVMVRLNHSGKN